MSLLRVFVSSVQSEFTAERAAIRDYFHGDPLLRRFFEVFLFEETPAKDRRPDDLYLEEVERCDIYLGLFGYEYGAPGSEGISPTEREFDRATTVRAHRLVFLRGADDRARHPRMRALVAKAQAGLIRKRFRTPEELKSAIYAALVEYLELRDLIRREPFDAAPCPGAALDDLDRESMARFVRLARSARQFAVPEDVTPEALLEHLELMNDGRPTNAAVLLFGKKPQRFLNSSEIRCARFHGTEVEKPIPSYQTYRGTVFRLIGEAVDFVLGKIDRAIGTRAESNQAPRTYEIPPEVVREAVVNAVAHRDYAENGNVQVMLFSDRLEVRNPGRLPHPLTFDMLRVPHRSIPGNRLLAHPLYLAGYIERIGTGTVDMIRQCADAGLPEPEFAIADGFVTTVRRPAAERPESGRVTTRDGDDAGRNRAGVQVAKQGVQVGGQVGVQVGVQVGESASADPAQMARDSSAISGAGRPERPETQDNKGTNTLDRRAAEAATTKGREGRRSGGQVGVQVERQGVQVGVQVSLDSRDSAMLEACAATPASSRELQTASGSSSRGRLFRQRLRRLLSEQLLALTVPDHPNSSRQKYRLTDRGRAALARDTPVETRE